MMKHAAMATSGARPSVNSEPRATNAMMRNVVAAMTITLASPAILLRHIAQTAATTQTARSASANSTTPSCQVEIAVVSANANVSVGPSNTRRAHLAPDAVERLKLDAGARLEPRRQPEDGHGNERCRQEDAGQERAGWRRAEERQSRNNDDPVDIGAEPRERAILLAQERGIEGRLGRVEGGRSAARRRR